MNENKRSQDKTKTIEFVWRGNIADNCVNCRNNKVNRPFYCVVAPKNKEANRQDDRHKRRMTKKCNFYKQNY